jgi:spoIIIJ-associated protein
VEERNERRNVVASGKTVDEAISNGLKMLGVRRDQVEIEIITEGSRGVLGFGAENAQVQLWVKLPPKPEPRPQPQPRTQPRQEPAVAPPAPPAPEPKAARVEEKEAQEEEEEVAPEVVGHEILTEVLRLMGIQAVVETKLGHELAEEGEEPPAILNITGEDLGILIGRRGETFRAL